MSFFYQLWIDAFVLQREVAVSLKDGTLSATSLMTIALVTQFFITPLSPCQHIRVKFAFHFWQILLHPSCKRVTYFSD